MNESRNTKAVLEAAIANPNISFVRAHDPARLVGLDALMVPAGAAALSLLAGYLSGQVVPASWLSVALYVLLFMFQQQNGVVRFEAGFETAEDEEPEGDVFLPYEEKTIRITARQRDGIKVLAERYPAVKNLAYEVWTPASVCFSRPLFLELRQILQQMKMADEMHDGQLKVNSKGEEAFGRWRAGDLGDFDAPPPPTPANGGRHV